MRAGVECTPARFAWVVFAMRPLPAVLRSCITANRRFCKEGGLGYRSRPISRVLSLDSHSSRPAVADRLKQPTRILGEQRRGILFGLAADGVWPATDCCQPHGALLPHHFTLTCAALPQPSAVMLSVPLSVASRRPAVSRHPALCSPDFPPRPKGAATVWPTAVRAGL